MIFRNESDNVIKKFKAKEAKVKAASKSPPSDYSTPAEASDGGAEGSLEIVQQWPSPMLQYSLAQPIEERATVFFVANYVIGNRGPTRGHLDYLGDLYQTGFLPEGLMASMKAVGLAGYSHAANAPSLMKNARYQYMRALQFTNAALRSPVDVKKDTTLMAVMILGIFETVTGCNQNSVTAWAEHVTGAAALLKLRGIEQFRTAGGRRMFIQSVSTLMISCIQRGLPLPDFVVEWTAETRRRFEGPPDPAWTVQELMMDFTNFHAAVVDGSISDPEVILTRSLELDGRYLEIFDDIPPGWRYQTIFADEDSGFIYNRRYHIYYDYWIAQMWNGMRTVRVILNEKIRDILLEGFAAKPPRFNKPEHTAQFQISTDTLYQMQADILASVPQHLGATPCPPSTPSAANNPPQINDQLLPWSNFPERNEDTFPVVRASGSYFLLWPLWFAGVMDVATEPVRIFAIRNLKFIGNMMGVSSPRVFRPPPPFLLHPYVILVRASAHNIMALELGVMKLPRLCSFSIEGVLTFEPPQIQQAHFLAGMLETKSQLQFTGGKALTWNDY